MTEKKPLFILAGNGPYDNRGCEAIIRGTVEILRHYYNDPSFLCISHFQNNEQFKKQCKEEVDSAITHKKTNLIGSRYSLGWFHHKILKKIKPNANKYLTYKEMSPYLSEAKAVLSVGGDNYSLDYGIPKLFTDLDDIVLKNGQNLVIWGASVGPFDKNPIYEKYMAEHLHDVTAIFARESATIEYLNKIGVKDNVQKVADPAFLMKPTEPKGTEINIEAGAIGINLSPLMARYVTNGDVEKFVNVAAEIITLISKRTTRTIYLIPHVTTSNSNDYIFLKDILAMASSNKKANIILIPPIYNASETKWIISKMFVFAGARTHSTIAALSSCIPTLSFAYSVKAKGINKDIFNHDEFCLNPNDLLNPNMVINKIEHIIDNYDLIRNELCLNIEIINECSLNSGKSLRYILDDK